MSLTHIKLDSQKEIVELCEAISLLSKQNKFIIMKINDSVAFKVLGITTPHFVMQSKMLNCFLLESVEPENVFSSIERINKAASEGNPEIITENGVDIGYVWKASESQGKLWIAVEYIQE